MKKRLKKQTVCFIVILLIFANSASIIAESTVLIDETFDSLDNWVTQAFEGSSAESAQTDADDVSIGILRINNTTTAAVSATYSVAQKLEVDYTFEFDMNIVKNSGNIIAQVYVGKERTQLNITQSGNNLMLPATDESGSTHPKKQTHIPELHQLILRQSRGLD